MRRALFGSIVLGLLGLFPADGASGQALPDVGVAAREVATVRAERERATAEVDALRDQHGAARHRLARRVRMLHRLRRAGSLPLAAGFDAVLRHQSRVTRLERLVGRDARAFQAIGHRVTALEAEAERLAQAERESEELLGALQREEDERRSELELIGQMMEDPNAWVGPSMGQGFGLRLSDAPLRGFQLAEHRGRLPLPVGGSAQMRDAEREGGGGLEIVASAGVSVRAVGPGTVSFAATHPAYGRLVIIDHGDGHYTVYGGLGAITTRPGSAIEREAVLGAIGPQPLFFQVRRGTRPLPAREWLGI